MFLEGKSKYESDSSFFAFDSSVLEEPKRRLLRKKKERTLTPIY